MGMLLQPSKLRMYYFSHLLWLLILDHRNILCIWLIWGYLFVDSQKSNSILFSSPPQPVMGKEIEIRAPVPAWLLGSGGSGTPKHNLSDFYGLLLEVLTVRMFGEVLTY